MKAGSCILGSVVVALLGASLLGSGCGGDEDKASPAPPPSDLCEAVSDYVENCADSSACDQAILNDCPALAGLFNEPFVRATAWCVSGGLAPAYCVSNSIKSLQPTPNQLQMAATFCAGCAAAEPRCTELMFSNERENEDLAVAGALVLPFNDTLASELSAECTQGPTCLDLFPTCAQGVLVKKGLPTDALTCLLDGLMRGSEYGPGNCVDGGLGGAGGADASTGGMGGTGGAAGTGPGGSGGTGPGGSGGTGVAGSGGTGVGGTGGTGGGPTCPLSPATPNCSACMGTSCAMQCERCAANPDCVALKTCTEGCSTESCLDDCLNDHGGGQPLLDSYNACYFGTCYLECTSSSCGITYGDPGCDGCVTASCEDWCASCSDVTQCRTFLACTEQCTNSTCIDDCRIAHPIGAIRGYGFDTCVANSCMPQCGN